MVNAVRILWNSSTRWNETVPVESVLQTYSWLDSAETSGRAPAKETDPREKHTQIYIERDNQAEEDENLLASGTLSLLKDSDCERFCGSAEELASDDYPPHASHLRRHNADLFVEPRDGVLSGARVWFYPRNFLRSPAGARQSNRLLSRTRSSISWLVSAGLGER